MIILQFLWEKVLTNCVGLRLSFEGLGGEKGMHINKADSSK